MSWYHFIDIGTPLVFSPKVTPDAANAERLTEKFQQAMQRLHPQTKRDSTPTPLPNSIALKTLY